MKRVSLVIVSTLILTIVISNAMAQPMGYGKGKWGSHNLMFILNASELGLSQDQKDKIFNIHIQTKQKIDSLRTELMKIRYEISKELIKDNPDFNKVKDYESKIAKIRSDIYLTTSEARMNAISLLTPDQRKKLTELLGNCTMSYGNRMIRMMGNYIEDSDD